MKTASERYLVELADDFLSTQISAGFDQLAKSEFRGETVWIDPNDQEPGVEVEVNIRRNEDAIEIEVVAYQPGDGDEVIASVTRKARVVSQ